MRYARRVSRSSLVPGLLLAAPRLGDPNFERSVVLLGRHSADGSLGWVLNGRALAPVKDLLRDSGLVPGDVTLPAGGAFDRIARKGGPVAPATGWLLYVRGDTELPGEMNVGSSLGVTGDLNALQTVMRGGQPADFRLLLGYAGWGPGQLENEVASGAWLPVSVSDSLVLDTESERLWDQAYFQSAGVTPIAFTSTRRGQA